MTDVLDQIRLDEEQFLALSPQAQDEYLEILAAERASWSLRTTPKAMRGHLLSLKVDHCLLGGAAGGGKSEAMLYHAWDLSKRHPGHRSLIVRNSLPELRRSLVPRSLIRFTQTGDAKPGKRGGVANTAEYAVLRHQDNVRTWWFPNGSTIELGWLDDTNVSAYLSAEYEFVGIDESTTISAYTLAMIGGRLRTSPEMAAAGVRPHVMMGSNPGSISFAHHRELYVKLTDYGREVVVLDVSAGFTDKTGRVDWDKVRVIDRLPAPQTPDEVAAFSLDTDRETQLSLAFVPFFAKDNPHLDVSYIRNLNALPERERRRQLYGDWDIADDAFFPEFDRAVHVIEPFEIPDTWEVGIGADHGYAKPFASLNIAWDPDGYAYAFAECYQARLTPQQQAEQMLASLEYEDDAPIGARKIAHYRPRHRVADPATFSSQGEGKAIADQWAEAGMRFEPAIRARPSGWANMREYLRLDDDGVPLLRIFHTCKNFIRELSDALTDEDNPEDLDTDQPDHALDAGRYLLAQKPRKRKRREAPKLPEHPLERLEARNLDRIRRQGRRLR